jgi:putative ABC transport system permease protein
MLTLKLALRTLLRTPFVTMVAVLSLALGIGANAAIFSLFNQMLLRTLPVQEPQRLVNFRSPGPKAGSTNCGQAGDCDAVFSYGMFRDLQKAQTVFTDIAAHVPFDANVAAGGQTSNEDGLLVSGSYFPVLGVQPALGRLLTIDDDPAIGESHVAVLSHALWQTRFGLDPNVLNQSIVVNGQSLTIVGVAARGFNGTTLGYTPEVFVPITLRDLMQPPFKRIEGRRNYWAYLFARLRTGVSREQAATAMHTIYRAILNDVDAPLQTGMSPQTLARFKARELLIEPGSRGQSSAAAEARAPLTLLLGVTAFVLLIACANIANLLLARSAARAGEMAVRLSIGAGRWQLVRQLLSESLMVAAIGGAAGLLVARWTLSFMVSILPREAADTLQPRLDLDVLMFATAVTVGTGLLFGLFPALHSTRPDLISSLKGQAGQPSGARAASRFRTSLATTQIALSMALLVAAGLFTRSLLNVSRVNLGLNVDNIIMFNVSPVLNGYKPEQSVRLFEQLEHSLAGLPGVVNVTTGRVPLLSGSNWGSSVAVEGFGAGPDTNTDSRYNEVGTDYFRTLGIPLIAGREFTPADALGAPKVAVVNQAFAKKFNLGRDAVGKHIGTDGRTSALAVTIVGLVQNAKYSEVKQAIPPVFFIPYRQDDGVGSLTFYLRTAVPPESIFAGVRKAVAELDRNLPVVDMRTLPQQIRDNVFVDRFISTLSIAFAGLATLLAAIGLYGVLAYTVAQRTREIGLRMALGAAPERVRRMILRQVGAMTLVGGTIGLAAAISIGWLAQSLLFELKGWDPGVLGVSAVVLSIVALGAGFIPAQRASRVEPMRALRYE